MDMLDNILFFMSLALKIFTVYFAVVAVFGSAPAPCSPAIGAPDPFCGSRGRTK